MPRPASPEFTHASMPVWPKSFYSFGLSLKTASTEWKLRKAGSGADQQERTLAEMLPRLAATTYWRQAGIEAQLPYPTFQTRVPLQTYEQLAPEIERMKRGDRDVLWPGRCALFVNTPGTSTGQPKCLPMTEEMLTHFRRAGLDALLYYTVRVRHAGVFRGRHLLHASPTRRFPVDKTSRRWRANSATAPGNPAIRVMSCEAVRATSAARRSS